MKWLGALSLTAILVSLGISACAPGAGSTAAPPAKAEGTALTLTSTAFATGEPIPAKYTCDGEDISPPLQCDNLSADTQSFALIMDDPDAPGGTWVHWVLFDLPSSIRGLPEAVPPDADLTGGGRHGNNSWPRLGCGGPCPPSGTHRYSFRLYALDSSLDLEAGVRKEALLQAMEGHVLAEAELMGTYARP